MRKYENRSKRFGDSDVVTSSSRFSNSAITANACF